MKKLVVLLLVLSLVVLPTLSSGAMAELNDTSIQPYYVVTGNVTANNSDFRHGEKLREILYEKY